MGGNKKKKRVFSQMSPWLQSFQVQAKKAKGMWDVFSAEKLKIEKEINTHLQYLAVTEPKHTCTPTAEQK